MILVTGGTGFIGRSLVAALVDRQLPVRVLVRARERAEGLPPAVEVASGDLLDTSRLEAALGGVSVVLHLAARHGASVSDGTIARVNAEGTERLAEAAGRRKVSAFIHVSSAAVYGTADRSEPCEETARPVPTSIYGRSKLQGEEAVRRVLGRSGTRWIILRPSSIFGPGRNAEWYGLIQRRTLWLHAGPVTVVHPLYLEDTVQAILAALTRDDLGEVILNVAGDRALPYAEWLSTIARMGDGRLRQIQLPIGPTRLAALGMVAALRAAGLTPPLRLARLAWRADNRSLDISRARRLLDFVPTPLEVALSRTLEASRRGGRASVGRTPSPGSR